MPYNIDPPCPAGQETNIIWQYSGQAQKSSTAGDDYLVSQGYFAPTEPRVKLVVFADFTHAAFHGYEDLLPQERKTKYAEIPRARRIIGVGNEILNPWRDLSSSDYDQPATKGQIAGYYVFYEYYRSNTGRTYATGQEFIAPDKGGGIYFTGFSNLRIVAVTATQQEITNNYDLTIFKNGVAVTKDRGTQPPTVSYQCVTNQCPPNTCDVLCGNTICCYNSEGVSVFNYPNT